jgi:hypothetical protein
MQGQEREGEAVMITAQKVAEHLAALVEVAHGPNGPAIEKVTVHRFTPSIRNGVAYLGIGFISENKVYAIEIVDCDVAELEDGFSKKVQA